MMDNQITKNEAGRVMEGRELVAAQDKAVGAAFWQLDVIFIDGDHHALCPESRWLFEGAHSRLKHILDENREENRELTLALARRAGKLNGKEWFSS